MPRDPDLPSRPPRPNPRPAGRPMLPPDPRSFAVPAPEVDAAPGPASRRTAPAPEPTPRPGATGARRRWRWAVLGAAALVALLAASTTVYVVSTYRKLERVPVRSVLSPGSGSGTNYLIVGTDSREGLDPDVDNADVIFGEGVTGARSDTVVIMRMGAGDNLMMPIPRDLYVPIVGTNSRNRINTAIQGGPERLIRTVSESLGVPVHHYVEIDFAGFLDLVDAVGGVVIDFDAPAFDVKSGLDVKAAGPQKLDKAMALAYVRSRTYTRVVDGRNVVDPRGDLGRIERQQTFLRSVMHQVGGTRNPLTLARIGDAIARNLKVDDAIGFFDALGLARKLGGLDPQTVDLPTTPSRTSGGASVLLLSQPGAEAALASLR